MGLVARVGTRVAGRYTSAGLEAREALPVSRDFFGATPSQLAQGNSSVFNPPPRSAATTQPCNWAVSEWLHGCAVAGKCLEGGRHPGGWKNTTGLLSRRNRPAEIGAIFGVGSLN